MAAKIITACSGLSFSSMSLINSTLLAVIFSIHLPFNYNTRTYVLISV